MSLFSGPEEHAANPPETWRIVKAAERVWNVCPKDSDDVITSCKRKIDAEMLKEPFSWLYAAYAKEGRWYAGENISGWRPYAECQP